MGPVTNPDKDVENPDGGEIVFDCSYDLNLAN